MKAVVVFALALASLANGGILERISPGTQEQICTPGSKTLVDCNTCTCSKDGTALSCTRMVCPKIPAGYLNPDGSTKLPYQTNPLLRNKRDQLCEPGTSRQENCDECSCTTCFCEEDGHEVCQIADYASIPGVRQCAI